MKKLLFVLSFAFIGQQSFSQMYIVTISGWHTGGCGSSSDVTLTKVDPTGTETNVCINKYLNNGALGQLNQELNGVVSLGYKLIETSYDNSSGTAGLIDQGSNDSYLNTGVSFIFAIPVRDPRGFWEVRMRCFTIGPMVICGMDLGS